MVDFFKQPLVSDLETDEAQNARLNEKLHKTLTHYDNEPHSYLGIDIEIWGGLVIITLAVGVVLLAYAARVGRAFEEAVNCGVVNARRRWWRLDRRLRLALVVSAVWVSCAYLVQDSDVVDLAIVFVPPLGLLVLHLAVRYTVEGAPPRPGGGAEEAPVVAREDCEVTTPATRKTL